MTLKGSTRVQRVRFLAAMAALGLITASACGQAKEKEPAAVVEIGAASESVLHGETSFGPSVAVETTVIDDWLELEAGVTPFLHDGLVEWDTDFLFKKPYTLSKTLEFMAGVGPEWDHSRENGRSVDVFGAEVAGDFMYWPWRGRKVGLYAEPSYTYAFNGAHEKSFSVSFGILIPIPRRR